MINRFIIEFDKGLRTVLANAQSVRPFPDHDYSEASLDATEKRHAAALMRVNHSGEVCAQALYNGQSLASRNTQTEAALQHASREEREHLAWCEKRINDLGGRKSLLNPILYVSSLGLGALTGALGDKWSFGFLAETEHQVGKHLQSHLDRLPARDEKSRAILEQMMQDEAGHAGLALEHCSAELPKAIKVLMQITSKMMTKVTYYL